MNTADENARIISPAIDVSPDPKSDAATLNAFAVGLRRAWDKGKYPSAQSFADALGISVGRLDELLSANIDPSILELWAINQIGISLDQIMGI